MKTIALILLSVILSVTGHSADATDSDVRCSTVTAHHSGSGDGIVKTWREELGGGGFVICTKYTNGYVTRVRYRPCPNCRATKVCASCHGTRRCAICSGRGGIVSAGYGNWIPCAMCGQSGRCNLCKGTGQCACVSVSPYPGYVIGSTATIAPDGSTNRETVDYNNSNRRNSAGSGSTAKKTCPDCGGTRLWRRGTKPEYAQPRSQLVGHYNPSGTKCRYCGHYDRHWHSKCTTCKHYPGTKNPYK